jgi:hypothetical protein
VRIFIAEKSGFVKGVKGSGGGRDNFVEVEHLFNKGPFLQKVLCYVGAGASSFVPRVKTVIFCAQFANEFERSVRGEL